MKYNRTIIGLICILVAMVIAFGLAPLTNRITDNREVVVRVKSKISAGNKIEADSLEEVKVGSYNLAQGVITNLSSVVGKYAVSDLYNGDFLFEDKLRDAGNSASDVFTSLNGKKQAVSMTVHSYASGVSGKLENGDIITLFAYVDGQIYMPPELRYVQVITTTSSTGYDKDEIEGREQPVTITILLTRKQAKLLNMYENTGKLSCSLVFRGEAKDAALFIKEQDRYLDSISQEVGSNG